MAKVYGPLEYYNEPRLNPLFEGTLKECRSYIESYCEGYDKMIIMDDSDPENNQIVGQAKGDDFYIRKQWNNQIGGWNYVHDCYGLIVDSLVANVEYLELIIQDLKK